MSERTCPTHNYDVWHVAKGMFSNNKSMQFMILEYNEIEKKILELFRK